MHIVAAISMFMILSVVLLSSFVVAYAKILPASQPDMHLYIGTEEILSTDETFESFYNDVGNVHQFFDDVMVPSLKRFVEEHTTELEDKDVDWIWLTYNLPSEMRVNVGPVYGTVRIEETYAPKLKTINSIVVRLAVNWWYTRQLDDGVQLPNASARIAYLTYQMQDLLARHKSDMITSTGVEQGAQVGKLPDISGVMFEDMARISAWYKNEGYVTEYANGINLLVPRPPSASNLNTAPPLRHDDFILFAKSANKPLSIYADLSTYAKVSNATLIHPDGNQMALNPVRVESEKSESETEAYNHYQYWYYLESNEPSGIYKIFIDGSPTYSPSTTHLDISVIEGYFPRYDSSWSAADTIYVDNARYVVRYRISENTQVATISVDVPQKSVLVTIEDAKPDSELIIELPRDLVDSLFDSGADKRFVVMLSDDGAANEGGESIEYEEIIANDKVRVLTIGLDSDTALVQIRGTQIVPEFDPVVLLCLTVAGMAGSIAVLRRVKYPKIT
ncbi:MAG: hypothetical protein ACREAZ_04065 [Nitrososphaera sp.]